MNAADIELAKMIYLASSLGVVLFTSMILRGLWRPLRFLILACVISIFFTPYFVEQKMPDGAEQNMVPAVVVLGHKIADDRSHWRDIAMVAGKPIAVVGGINCGIALILALLLPKPRKKIPAERKKPEKAGKKSTRKSGRNPYLPDDFQSPATSQE